MSGLAGHAAKSWQRLRAGRWPLAVGPRLLACWLSLPAYSQLSCLPNAGNHQQQPPLPLNMSGTNYGRLSLSCGGGGDGANNNHSRGRPFAQFAFNLASQPASHIERYAIIQHQLSFASLIFLRALRHHQFYRSRSALLCPLEPNKWPNKSGANNTIVGVRQLGQRWRQRRRQQRRPQGGSNGFALASKWAAQSLARLYYRQQRRRRLSPKSVPPPPQSAGTTI